MLDQDQRIAVVARSESTAAESLYNQTGVNALAVFVLFIYHLVDVWRFLHVPASRCASLQCCKNSLTAKTSVTY